MICLLTWRHIRCWGSCQPLKSAPVFYKTKKLDAACRCSGKLACKPAECLVIWPLKPLQSWDQKVVGDATLFGGVVCPDGQTYVHVPFFKRNSRAPSSAQLRYRLLRALGDCCRGTADCLPKSFQVWHCRSAMENCSFSALSVGGAEKPLENAEQPHVWLDNFSNSQWPARCFHAARRCFLKQ